MTPAERAKIYRWLLNEYEGKGLTFRDIANKKGKTFQHWQQQYVKACAWREKYGAKKNDS